MNLLSRQPHFLVFSQGCQSRASKHKNWRVRSFKTFKNVFKYSKEELELFYYLPK